MFKKYIFIYLLSQGFLMWCMEEPRIAVERPTEINKKQYDETYDTDFPLHCAVKKGRIKVVKEIISNKQIDIDSLDDEGKSSLYFACLYREYGIIKFLLSKNADKESMRNAAFLAKHDYAEVVELFIIR